MTLKNWIFSHFQFIILKHSMNTTFQSNRTIFSITTDDFQDEAIQKLGRELTDEEIDLAKDYLEWGILSSIDIVYNTIFNDIKEKQ